MQPNARFSSTADASQGDGHQRERLLADGAFVDCFSLKDLVRQAGERGAAADKGPAVKRAVVDGFNDAIPALLLTLSGAGVAIVPAALWLLAWVPTHSKAQDFSFSMGAEGGGTLGGTIISDAAVHRTEFRDTIAA